MKQITIIVPVHKYEEELLNKALVSVPTGENYGLMFVGPTDVCKSAEKLCKKLKLNVKISSCYNDEETDFYTQINKAVFKCITPFFSILEYDDTYSENYFGIAQKYIEENPSWSVILPMNVFTDVDGKMVSFGNELALDATYTTNIGTIDFDTLNEFMDFNCTGGIFKTEDFISVGGLKKSLKLAAWYEFLLRECYKEKSINVIPRIGYFHTIKRDGSYMETMHKEISREEGKWLIDTAKQEYFFKEDRNKSFNDENKEE